MSTTVPWCDSCDRLVADGELTDEGACPTCGTTLETRRPVPWHFKLMILASVIYLGWRAYQGVAWLVHHA